METNNTLEDLVSKMTIKADKDRNSDFYKETKELEARLHREGKLTKIEHR